MFKKATREKSRLRAALVGPSGSGKTYTALALATSIADGGTIAVIDTERGSASKYAGRPFDFDVQELDSYDLRDGIASIQEAGKLGYSVLVIDSLTHFWTGKSGALETVDTVTKKAKSNNSYATGWRDVTPLHNRFVDAILASPCHVIVTMRVKTEYVMEKNSRGQTAPRKVGLKPIQRDGVEYEFDVVGDLDAEHTLIVSKTRCSAIEELNGGVWVKPGEELGAVLRSWLQDGEDPKAPVRDIIFAELQSASTPDELEAILAKIQDLQKTNELSQSDSALLKAPYREAKARIASEES